MKKFTFEQAKEKLLYLGFTEIEVKPQKGIVNLGTFELSCPYCKTRKGTISFYHQNDDDEIWIQGYDGGSSWDDPFNRRTLRYSLRQFGIKSKDC